MSAPCHAFSPVARSVRSANALPRVSLKDPGFVDDKSAFYGGQQVNKEFAAISATVTPDFAWLPFMDYAYSSFNETLGKAFADRTDLATGLKAWQAALTTYATQQGFTVK